MTWSDTLRQVEFTLAVGSIGFGAGYITFTKGGIADIIEEHQKQSALEREAQQAYEAERNQYIPPPAYVAPVRYGGSEFFYCIGLSCAM